MSNFGSEVVRKVVAKCKALGGRLAGTHGRESEWETTVEEDSGTGWDSHTNPAWEQPPEQKAEEGWDSRGGPSPGEAKTIRDSNDRDSGYISLDDAAWNPSSDKNTPPRSAPISSDETKYRNLTFRQKHYLLTYIQTLLEAICLRYARAHLSAFLSDPEWKKLNLLFPSSEYLPDRLVGRDWLAEDETELESWMQLFARCKCGQWPQKRKRVFESVMDLRNAATHRGDRGQLEFEELALAMELPRLLGDEVGEAEIANAWRFAIEDERLDEETKERVRRDMFGPRPCTTRYGVLARIQSMLEESCFRAAEKRFPDVLEQLGWSVPEQVELQNWSNVFQRYLLDEEGEGEGETKKDDSNSTAASIKMRNLPLLLDLLGGARIHIRIPLAHRLPLSDEKLEKQVQRAIDICILLDDLEQASKIGKMVEGYFEGREKMAVEKL